jgi:hypothetical protein
MSEGRTFEPGASVYFDTRLRAIKNKHEKHAKSYNYYTVPEEINYRYVLYIVQYTVQVIIFVYCSFSVNPLQVF